MHLAISMSRMRYVLLKLFAIVFAHSEKVTNF